MSHIHNSLGDVVMKKRIAFLVLLLVIVMTVVPLQAQEEDHPLMEILALIPDTPEVRQWGLSYMDYRAIVEARLGDLTPTSVEELNAEQAGGGTVGGIWRAALNGTMSGPGDFLQSVIFGMEDTPEVVGFDFFDVRRGATFLQPPETVTMFEGSFDTEAIAEAYTNRDYTSSDLGGMTLWCAAGGCGIGIETNLSERNQANPFGGHLGRKQPLLVSDNIIISTTNDALLYDYPAMRDDTVSTLADAPDVQAAARAVLQSGQLIQAHFYGPTMFIGTDSTVAMTALLDPQMTDEERAAVIEELRTSIESGTSTLPYYSLVVLADVVEDNAQFVRIGLVYTDAEVAQMAADVVYARMLEYQSEILEVALRDLLLDRTAFLWQPQLYTDDVTGLTVVVLTIRAPMPPNEKTGDLPMIPASSMVFRLMISMIYQRDMGWLAVGEQ
jgi:hypothetical protein